MNYFDWRYEKERNIVVSEPRSLADQASLKSLFAAALLEGKAMAEITLEGEPPILKRVNPFLTTYPSAF
jgi:hypothetical protein